MFKGLTLHMGFQTLVIPDKVFFALRDLLYTFQLQQDHRLTYLVHSGFLTTYSDF